MNPVDGFLDGYGKHLLGGLGITVALASVSMMVASAMGALAAWGGLSGGKATRRAVRWYIAVVRGVPDYVLLLIVYFGGQQVLLWVSQVSGDDGSAPDNHPFWMAVISIGLVFGTHMAESIRGAWLAIPRGQLDAAAAAGMSRTSILLRVALPPLVVHGLPAFSNVWLVVVKTTAIASLVGIDDLLRRAQAAAQATQNPFHHYLAALLGFLLLTSVSNRLLRWAQNALVREAPRSG